MNNTTHRYLTVRIGMHWYGIALEHVIEVLHLVALNEVPGTEPHVLGLLTLRERIMTVLDMRVFFKQANTALSLNSPLIALRSGDQIIAIVVDEVDDVIAVEAAIQTQTESLYLLGAVQLPTHMLMILNLDRLIADHATAAGA